MKLQCSFCGSNYLLVGNDPPPTNCPVCKHSTVSSPVETSPCFQCGTAYPLKSTACPHCHVERVKREMSKENLAHVIPDDAPPPKM
jgi:hypothetical protein